MSLMSGKSLAVGEAGIMFTDDQRIYERALLFGHYSRHGDLQLPDLKEFAGLPCGGYKYRMHQLSSAFGRVALKLYPAQMAEIAKAMNHFCDLLESMPGLKPIRPEYPDSTRGGWYNPTCLYVPEELGGLSNKKFAEAVTAEGSRCGAGCNSPLHVHPLFSKMDVYGHGKPTRIANLPEGVELSQPAGSLPIAEGTGDRVVGLPWFTRFVPEVVEQHAGAYRKVAEYYRA